ncbi:YdcF family protein [Ovoidimarina sediminis]|uniref:YdcF family protein n=1 Tax=Ovoidimarina sediminis TaxID=3079856 RepID=UPI0029114B7E|nr:YdcF family protein [Rhodophyticola sp. MJ-SS7]MDU8945019.1 YdcF family protein [Rhodophyticola sp. MJ-SS7]
MALLAVSLGVPEPAIVIEPLADSTLQNAYYAAETGGLRRDDPVIVVTSRYHLPRALVSLRLAGYRNLHGIAATPRVDLRSGDLHAEVVKWPANLLRGGAARLALGLGIPRDRVMPWLR